MWSGFWLALKTNDLEHHFVDLFSKDYWNLLLIFNCVVLVLSWKVTFSPNLWYVFTFFIILKYKCLTFCWVFQFNSLFPPLWILLVSHLKPQVNPRSLRFYLSTTFIVLALIVSVVIHFKFIFVYGMGWKCKEICFH